jgi:hypothetical protein
MYNILSQSFLSKNVKFKIHRTIFFPVILCGCETWSLTLSKRKEDVGSVYLIIGCPGRCEGLRGKR